MRKKQDFVFELTNQIDFNVQKITCISFFFSLKENKWFGRYL